MKTFFTSSLLGVLCAIVFGWGMVRLGGEMPGRSPGSYPPMPVESKPGPAPVAKTEVEVIPEFPLERVPEIVQEEPPEKVQGEMEEPKPLQLTGRKPSLEVFGPPAPVLPFVLNINGAEEGVTLQGSIPTQQAKAAIEEAVANVFEEEVFENRLKFSPDTRSGLWISYLPDFLARYFEYTGGDREITIVDDKLILAGAVASEEAKKIVIGWTKPFRQHGLAIIESVDVDDALKGEIGEIPEKLAAVDSDNPAQAEPAVNGEQITEAVPDDPLPVSVEEIQEEEVAPVEAKGEDELVFMGPFDEFYEVHTVPFVAGNQAVDEEPEVIHVSESETPDSAGGNASEVEGELVSSDPVPDDGKPLIFYFETGSAEIAASDHEKIRRAIQRASHSRSIVYITGYSDYRGSFELNQKLALARANRVKSLIFAGNLPDQVTAEVSSKGDSQSRYSTNDSDAVLQHSRRVVVEVYQLK
ncbi:MAG: OmpA family protein [Verrucomicrobiales bacterium]|nr:OmpA family protein [Verrucomicrobiales bacterium]